MQTLYTTHYGSYLYGTSTPLSDVDYKHIVLPTMDSLLLNKQLRNIVKNTATGKNTSNDVDNEYIHLQTFANAFVKGQTYALEIAYSVLSENHKLKTVYNPLFGEFVKELTSKFLTNNISALVGYAVNQANMYSLKGSRYQTITEIVSLLNTVDPTVLYKDTSKDFQDAVDALMNKHPRHCFRYDDDTGTGYSVLSKKLPFNNTMSQWLFTMQSMVSKYGSRAKESAAGVDWKATMHALRISKQGIDLLQNKKLEYPLNPEFVSRLLEVKQGKVDMDEISTELANSIDLIYKLQDQSTLPKFDDEFSDTFDTWLAGWVRKFYNISN